MLPASAGEPLPLGLRRELEGAFSAELGAIRIHRDADAQRATAEQGAMAFASGAHLYFAAGQFVPASVSGRTLIGHEVAHALQQASRRRSDGTWCVEDVHGSGAVQYQDEPVAADPAAMFNALVAVHLVGLPAPDPTFQPAVAAMRTAFAGQLPSAVPESSSLPQPALDFAAAVLDGRHDADGIATRGLIVDVLKGHGLFEAARHLIDTDTSFEMRAAFEKQAFQDFLVGQPSGQNWAAQLFTEIPEMRTFWTRGFEGSFRVFLYHPGRPAHVNNALESAIAEREVNWVSGRLAEGDRTRNAWRLLRTLDLNRVQLCNDAEEEVERVQFELPPTKRRLEVLRLLRISLDRAVADPVLQPFDRELASLYVGLTVQAIAVYEPVVAELDAGFARLSGISDLGLFDSPRDPLFGSGVSHPLGDELKALMLRQLALVVAPVTPEAGAAPDTDTFPSAEIFSQRLSAYSEALSASSVRGERSVDGLDARIEAALYQAATRRTPDQALMRDLALLTAVMDELRRLLNSYSRSADEVTPHFPDERRAFAIRLARAHAQIGHMLGWTELIEAARPLMITPEPLLYLASEWVVDAESPISRMEADFPENIDRQVLFDAPLTIRHVARWFRLERLKRERLALNALLTGEDAPTVDSDIPVRERMLLVTHDEAALHESMEDAETALREGHEFSPLILQDPQRFVVRDFELTRTPDYIGGYSSIIRAHPKTQLLLQRLPEGGAFIFPDEVGREMFCWLTPDLRPLLTFLVSSPVFARFVTEGSAADPLAWLNSLDAEGLDDLINEALQAELVPLEVEVPMLWRRLTTYRRRVLVLQAQERLTAYLENGARIGDPEYFAVIEIAREIDNFETTVRPNTEGPNEHDDRDIQMALILMDLAPQLVPLFGENTAHDRAADVFYQYVLLGIRVASDSSWRDRVVEVTHEDERLRALHDDATLTADVLRDLTTIKEGMEAHAVNVRNTRGFSTVENREGLLPIGRATAIHVGEDNSWTINAPVADGVVDEAAGDTVYIRDIYHDFQYFPPYGAPTPSTMRPGAGGVYAPPRLIVDGEEVDLSTPAAIEAAKSSYTLFLFYVNDVAFPVTAGDIEFLNTMHLMLIDRSLDIMLTRLGVVLETYANVMMGVTGVVFPEFMYAQLVITAAQLATSSEFRELVQQLFDDPETVLASVLETARGRYLQPEYIWRFLLLGGQHPLFRAATTSARPRGRVRTTGRVARILRGLRSIGQRIHGSIQRLREYTRPPLRVVQGNMLQRPKLVWILHRSVMLLELVSELLPSGTEFTAEDLTNIPADLSQNLRTLVEGLSRLELPERLFDNGQLVALLIEFVVSRLGFAGAVAEMVLDGIPVPVAVSDNETQMRTLLDDISEEVARATINNTSADPNNLWIQLLPEIQLRFHEARDNLVDAIVENVNALFDRINPALPEATRFAHIERPTGLEEMDIIGDELGDEAEGEGGEASAPFREPALGAAARTPPLARTAGVGLRPSTRSFYESRMGRDLSHVRLHGGAEGSRATTPLRAEALTSGSHVYMNPRLGAGSARHDRVLGHELTHVVQQTRPRAPGRPMAPVRGRPGLGVSAHRPSEQAADRVARALSESRAIQDSDLRAGSGREGAQPTVENGVTLETLNEIIAEITQVTGAGEFESRPTAGASRVPGVADAREIWTHALTAINAAEGDSHFARFMRDPPQVRGLIVEQINYQANTRIRDHVPGIAQLAQKPLTGRRPRRGPTTELDQDRFISLLQSFIFAARGIRVDFTRGLGTAIARADFKDIHMGWVGAGHRMWPLVMERSFPTMPEAERTELAREVRQFLSILGPQPFIWDSAGFQFSDTFKQRLTEHRDARRRGASVVPPKTEYLDTAADSRADNLSIRTHGNLTRRGIGPFHRESHHTTQYLLVEFFGNGREATQHAFPGRLRDVLPRGVAFDSDGSVDSISTGSNTLDILRLDPDSGRGNNMPAILLAATTHQRADLHVTPEAEWNIGANGTVEEHGTRAQGIAMKNHFNALLPENLRMQRDNPETRARIRSAVSANRVNVETEIYNATLATYHWMRGRMLDRLHVGLRGEEVAYYRRIAARDPANLRNPETDRESLVPAYDLNPPDMDPIWRRACENNDAVMAAAGWPAGS